MSDIPSNRVAAVYEILDGIIDPCSAASSVPIGLVEMGIVDRVEVDESIVRIALLPTFAGCLFVGMFRAEIERGLLDLDWCSSVEIEILHAPTYWDESRIGENARRRLDEHRKARRRELMVLNR